MWPRSRTSACGRAREQLCRQGLGLRARKRNHGSASGDPSTPDDDYGHRCSCESNKRGCNRRSSDGDSCNPLQAGPSGVTSPSTTAPGPARPPAPPPAAAAQSRERDRRGTVLREPPRGGHLETGPSADALRLLRQGELSERRPLPLRPRESGRCTGRVQAERQRGSTRFSAETAVGRRHLPLLRARAVSERRELPIFPRRDETSAQAPALSAETSLLLRRLETGELPMYALDVECVATGKTHNDRAVAQIGLSGRLW